MRFAFTDDQFAMAEAVRDLLAKECRPEVVRAAWPEPDDGDGGDGRGAGARADEAGLDRLWSSLADMGVLGVAVPEPAGGLGLTEVDWVLLAEATGYAAVPQPFVETVCLGAPLLAAAADPTGDLADVLAGRLLVTTAVGGAATAPWAGSGRSVLVVTGDHELALHRAPAAPPLASVDGARRLGLVEPVAVDAGGRQRLRQVPLDVDRDVLGLVYDRGMLGTAAQLLGLARRMLDLTVAYVKERRQFGAPIGSFQAVKHHLADAALKIEFAAPAVYRAAWTSATNGHERPRDVSLAKVMAGEAATFTGRVALQCHGAIGYTVEHDLHLYLKRAWALSRAWGDATWHRDRVGKAIGV